jgi:hypothetical protein
VAEFDKCNFDHQFTNDKPAPFGAGLSRLWDVKARIRSMVERQRLHESGFCPRTSPANAAVSVAIPSWKPQISPLRFAPVEMTNLLHGKSHLSSGCTPVHGSTNLSSRPERSGVERSAVSFRFSHTLKALFSEGLLAEEEFQRLIRLPGQCRFV